MDESTMLAPRLRPIHFRRAVCLPARFGTDTLRMTTRPSARLIFWFCAVLLVGIFLPSRANAYPFMIRHGYTACAVCHADPSGGSLVTQYGRAQSDLLLRTRYGEERTKADEPSKWSGFAFGAFEPPDWLLLGGTFRGLALWNKVEGYDANHKFIQMQSDLRAGLKIARFRAYGSIGYQSEGARLAAVTTAIENNLVSREHWLGLSLDAQGEEDAILIRAGRIPLPFGIRTHEHTLWVRQSTKTDINERQQHGVAMSYQHGQVRSEVMAILGDFQTGPDVYRERGYSGFVEWAPRLDLAVGVSSLYAAAKRDVTGLTLHRQAHGVFFRAVPTKPVVLLGELDMLIDARALEPTYLGATGMLQADWEVTQGVHVLTTGELLRNPGAGQGTSVGGWLSLAWFFAPHMDLRVDLIEQSKFSPTLGRYGVTSLLGQVHLWL